MISAMIRILLCSLFLLIGCTLSLVAEELRVWKDRNGVEIQAILLTVESDQIRLLKNGKE